MSPLTLYQLVALLLLALGLFGICQRRSLVGMLICVELMLNAVNLNLVAMSHYLESLRGQAFTFFIITVAAAEAAIGLGIAIALYQHRRSVHTDSFTDLKG